MNTITIERELLEQALEALNSLAAISAELAKPATAPSDKTFIEALQKIERHGPIMGSAGEYRQGQLDILEAVSTIAKLALSAPVTAPEQPAWHDAPTCAGVWICDEDDICYTWTAHSIEILDQFDPGEGMRWFGPIPKDKP